MVVKMLGYDPINKVYKCQAGHEYWKMIRFVGQAMHNGELAFRMAGEEVYAMNPKEDHSTKENTIQTGIYSFKPVATYSEEPFCFLKLSDEHSLDELTNLIERTLQSEMDVREIEVNVREQRVIMRLI